MAIHSRGYTSTNSETAEEKVLFLENLHLILQHQERILSSMQYFLCTPAFAWCSWPYVGGDGPLPLGYLLMGWNDGLLTERCPSCNGSALVTAFGGSPLSGSCFWAGCCKDCGTMQSSHDSVHSPFFSKIQFISRLRKTFPESIARVKEFDGHNFSWGGSGLQPARKTKVVRTRVADRISLETLITKLKDLHE